MIMLFNYVLDCHTCQVDGLFWQKRNAQKQGCKQICAQYEINTFVHMEHFWDLLFQLMKHWTNTLDVA
jgi:hypothetical protein